MRNWVVLMWDGGLLYAVIGPFNSREDAASFVPSSSEEQCLKRTVVELYKPE